LFKGICVSQGSVKLKFLKMSLISEISPNTSTEVYVDLGSVHMTVKQRINSVKKESVDSMKTSNKLFGCHEDQTTV
jgi:hypothetical protein